MADFSTAIRKLEFDRILDRLKQLVVSEPGRELAASLLPSTSPETIQGGLSRVSEAKELLIAEGSVPLDGIKSIATALKKSSIENHILTSKELLDIASTLRAARSMASFISKRHKNYPQLAAMAAGLFYDKVVEYNILECIDEEGKIRDTASKELRRIRQEIISTADLLRKNLTSILKRISEKEFLQEEIITTRDGRMVIPVKVEHKNHVPGFIHSSSASGATVFIEPAETLNLNNALTELHLSEQRETGRILAGLTLQVQGIREQLEQTLGQLAALDLIFAKAKQSIEILGNPAGIPSASRVRLSGARHPVLLQKHRREEIVPLDLELGEDIKTLIITGPNAGGKSVAMKTVGLLALCTQAGLHIPASPESEMCLFDHIFVDIGDEQSIENDLSTYTSHLLCLRDILQRAEEHSLVLIDEIGAGTDPAEGGALAAAVLKDLTQRGAMTIATTHHGMLKAFAHETPGVSNASLEFDQETLKPTYKFRSGLPGSSYALELAKRLELPEALIDQARDLVGEEKVKLEKLLSDLERQSQQYRSQIQEVSTERDRLDSLVRLYDQKMRDLQKEMRSIRKQAVDEAQDLVQGAQALIERSIKEIRETAAAKVVVRSARESVQRLRQEVADLSADDQPVELQDFRLGDTVRFKDGSQTGEIMDMKHPFATVLSGNARLRVKLSELRKVNDRQGGALPASSALYTPEGKSEIDVRGLLGDEAIPKVQRFLDDATVAGLHRVDIIHGKGTGALRKKVGDFLKTYPHIKSYRLGEWNEGGTGVTVVELD
jgi:DNA mismatch repair protein MutS2